jgi:hypothetical protein
MGFLVAAVPGPPQVTLARATSPIVIDGDLDDPGWEGATRIETFYETVFSDNRVPKVKTLALLTYDDKSLYIGLRCSDPEPSKIRAPYVERDLVVGEMDNVAIFLDPRNDRRAAMEFRVSPRGIQADGIFNDANGNEDFSPDFFYETAAKITPDGWQAEVRIPLSSLRYPKTDPQTWGFLIWRNYPRDFRYAIFSSPLPPGSPCLICHSGELQGITGLPAGHHFVIAPHVTAQNTASAPNPGDPLSPASNTASVGLDAKWTPNASTVLDAAIRPDFSQVESDVAQVAVNNRFALFYPEKRPFFLEGIDLFQTPLQAVYTRTITDPRWGFRATGKLGSSSYTVLLAQDQGGGSVVIPGPTSSDTANQDFHSIVGIGRWRREFSHSFAGVLYTGREIQGGGFNRVFGPDFQWRPNDKDQITGQLLVSDTKTPTRPDLASEWDGRHLTSHGADVSWLHSTKGLEWLGEYQDMGTGFRADEGFIPQVGFRRGLLYSGRKFYPSTFFTLLKPLAQFEDLVSPDTGGLIRQTLIVGSGFQGRQNLGGEIDPLIHERVLTGNKVLTRTYAFFGIAVSPAWLVPQVNLQAHVGGDIDVDNAREGHGTGVTLTATVRPVNHLGLDLVSVYSYLDVDKGIGASARLFTAKIERLKATYVFSSHASLRLIGQYVDTLRDPSLYLKTVGRHDRTFSSSVLFTYRLNWQTALYAGYGDDRALNGVETLVPTDRQFFLKLTYAFQG